MRGDCLDRQGGGYTGYNSVHDEARDGRAHVDGAGGVGTGGEPMGETVPQLKEGKPLFRDKQEGGRVGALPG